MLYSLLLQAGKLSLGSRLAHLIQCQQLVPPEDHIGVGWVLEIGIKSIWKTQGTQYTRAFLGRSPKSIPEQHCICIGLLLQLTAPHRSVRHLLCAGVRWGTGEGGGERCVL